MSAQVESAFEVEASAIASVTALWQTLPHSSANSLSPSPRARDPSRLVPSCCQGCLITITLSALAKGKVLSVTTALVLHGRRPARAAP